jgi:dUTP pyrophosphatase
MASQIELIKFVKISKNATTPTKGSPRSAGYDLYASRDATIHTRENAIAPTDLKISVPHGTYGRIASRSSLAIQNVNVQAGVIDEDYRGPEGVVLLNSNVCSFEIKKGDKIAQLICEKIAYPALLEVSALDITQRGEKGFGSTGKRKTKKSESESESD